MEVTAEVRRWLLGETSGSQCSQVVLDRALTVLSNFKLASGCQLEVLGGPLGAIVGGYSDADWLHDEVFRKQPSDAICEAFRLLGFRSRSDGDWSNIVAEEVSLTYRRMCLRGHPSRGGAPRAYLKLQVAMELVRAFAGEAGPLLGQGEAEPTKSSATFVLDDMTLVRELQLSAADAEAEATKLPQDQLEEMNRALDEYILRQMCFKSEIVDEIARLHEDSAYAILGVSSDATDSEIKKAYRLIAMQCHPDKGGDKEDFQELNNAYEKIMEQRRAGGDEKWPKGSTGGSDKDDDSDEEELEKSKKSKETEGKKEKKDPSKKAQKEEKQKEDEEKEDAEDKGDEEAEEKDEADADGEGEYGDEGSNASLVEKAGKAAEEASRYAKTAAEFAHQAAEAAETARRGREQGSRDTLTKSVAHSAIVLTLTVVKAVRVVGYATLDVATQCRVAAKRNPAANDCADRAVTAMSLGLEALNAALACAEVTETTAADLQAPPTPEESAAQDGGAAGEGGSTAAAERFVGAAVRASLAAASASNAAMAAAIAAVEGTRECTKAVESKEAGGGEAAEEKRGKTKDSTKEDAKDEDEDEEDEEDAEAEQVRTDRVPPKVPTPEEAAAAALKRLVSQRNNNHKVLQRLNAEILGHQQNVRSFLRQNRQLIPNVSGDAKKKVFTLLVDYCVEAFTELTTFLADQGSPSGSDSEFMKVVNESALLVPFLQPQNLAIPVSVKARVLKMAALYDMPLAMKVLSDELFSPLASLVGENCSRELDLVRQRIQDELSSNVAETPAVAAGSAATPTAASCGDQTTPTGAACQSEPTACPG